MMKRLIRFRAWFALVVALMLTQGTAFALHGTEPNRPATSKSLRKKSHHRRLRWNPMFRPSRDSLLRQNQEIDRIELPRIQDDDELEDLKASNALVPILESKTVKIDRRLDPARRYCRPWTRDFVEDLSQAYYRQFRAQIQVNSAVRTVKVQKKLRRHNRNAAPAEGETASSHLAGVTVDLQRRGMSKEQVRFVQRYLFYLRELGLVEPEEERRQWVFHVMVFDRYSDWRQSQTLFPLQPVLDTEAAVTGSK
ncbi:MAG: DUF5715 family protein [Nitrospirales bacterium]